MSDAKQPCHAVASSPKAAGRGAWWPIFQWLSFAASFAILLAMSRGIFGWLAHSVFGEPREDMAHGWFIPVFTLALFWLKRRELRAAAGAPSLAGVFLALPGLLLFLAGSLGDQVRFSHVAAIWLLWCAMYAAWGRAFARLASFPVAFLLFTAPLNFLDFFTVRLRIAIAAASTFLLDGLSIPMRRVGTGLYCLVGEGFSLDVADPCSGMRSIFALAALTAGYAYLTQRTRRGKWLLFACSVPLAMLGNLARIFSIALVGAAFGAKTATGFYHDYSGYVTFLVAVMAMIAVGEAISRWFGDGGAGRGDGAVVPPAGGRAGRAMAAAAIAAMPLLLLATWRHVETAPAPAQESDAFIAPALLPLEGYTARYPFFCQNEQCLETVECENPSDAPAECPRCGGKMASRSLGEADLLPSDTRIMKCNYSDVLGNACRVSVVVNGRSRQSIHRPEICLPAQGWSIERGHVTSFELADGTSLPVHCMDIRPRSSASHGRFGHAYFFINPRQTAASHFKRIMISVADRAFARRVTRWAMVTISADEPFDTSDRRRAEMSEFLGAFLPMAFPEKEKE